MAANPSKYQPLTMEDENDPRDVTGRICVSPESTSSDIDNDDTEDPAQLEKKLLLPDEKILSKAMEKRKAQLIKIGIISIVCLLQITAVPIFFSEVDVFWDGLSETLRQSAKYSLFGTYILSCLFAPMLISLLGIKIIFVIGCFLTCFFVGANFLPLEYSVIPACLLTGFILGPFFTAQGVFVTNCVFRYCTTLTTCDPDAIINILNGFFYTVFFFGPIILDGTKILLVPTDSKAVNDIAAINSTVSCGADLCPELRTKEHHELFINLDTNDFDYSYHRIQALLGIYFLLAITAFIICAILFKSNHPLLLRLRDTKCCSYSSQYRDTEYKNVHHVDKSAISKHLEDGFGRWKNVFISFADLNVILIIPLFTYVGLQQSMMYNVFTKDIVGCRLDRRHVYLLRILAASCSVVMSFPVALLARYLGRFRLSLPTATIQLSLILTMSLWQPGLDEWGVLYIMAALWGLTDASWQVMVSAMVGRLFRSNKEVAFAQHRLWQMFGILLLDVLRYLLCLKIVLYLIIIILLLTMIAYTSFEIRVRLQIKDELSKNGSALTDVTLSLEGGATWMPTLNPLARRKRTVLSGRIRPSHDTLQ